MGLGLRLFDFLFPYFIFEVLKGIAENPGKRVGVTD